MRREGEEKEAKMIGLTPYPVLCRPSRATLCHESFVISSIRCLTSASDMPVAMAIISTDAPDANNLRIVAFFSFSWVIWTGTLVRYLSRICGTFPYDSVVPVPMIRVFIHFHIVFSINYFAKVQRIFVFSK